MRVRFFMACLLALVGSGCPGGGIGACDHEPDLTGSWKLSLAPLPLDGGTSTIPDPVTIDAQLEQGPSTDLLGLGRHVYGSLTASDPRYFGTIAVPRLTDNDGGKSGAIVACNLTINVPIAMPVTDDNSDQGPLRISLAGKVVAKGQMLGADGSHLILQDDARLTPLGFAWTGVRR